MKMGRRDLAVLVIMLLVYAAMSYAAGFRYLRAEFVAFAFVGGGFVVYFWKRDTLSVRAILITALLLRILFLPLVPGLTDDMFRYIWDGILASSGINPFEFIPSDAALSHFHSESLYRLLNSRDVYSVYPPVSQAIFFIGGLVYNGDWTLSYYVIKVIIAVLEFGGIWFLSRHISTRSLILLAWHPVILIASAGQGHTDALLVLFLGAGIVYAIRDRGSMAAALITVAGWVKLFPFFFLPLVWRRFGIKSAIVSGVVGVALALPLAAPYVPGNVSESLELYIRLFEFNAGAYYGVKKLFFIFTQDDWSKQLGPVFRLMFFLVLPVIYWMDWRRKWSITKAAVFISGALLLTATTIHPWYIVGLLVLIAIHGKPSWHWQWVGLLSIGTYLLYVGGPYWLYVNLTWIGFVVVYLLFRSETILQWIQRRRAKRKVRDILRFLDMRPHDTVLDLGAGEGYVGEEIRKQRGSAIELIDVIDINRVDLPFHVYDGQTLPLKDDSVDCTVLYYVLHHTRDPDRVLAEALRVSRYSVIVVESVYRNRWEHFLLRTLDPLANRLRSFGKMKNQEEFLSFKTTEEWKETIHDKGGHLLAFSEGWNPIHRKAFFLIET
ncbi:MAG: hypothetical protein BMS9Abin05_0966 [Rhodothermia bacterium]|nr:MAG: hypothetical protein BMS9Abin05_0966 [Rhodothermia bacterium]